MSAQGRVILELRDVSTYYGGSKALSKVSLQVSQGEIVVLLGSNGAGKTTVFNTICGVVPPRLGDVIFYDQHVSRLTPEVIVRLGICQIPERRQIFIGMTVLDNIVLGAYTRYGKESKRDVKRDLDWVFGLFPILKERQGQVSGTLSGGGQQMLAFARGLMAKPKLLLLDEPSLGLAPLVAKEVFSVTSKLPEDTGMSILLAEQNAKAALKIANRGYVLNAGIISLSGTAEQLISNSNVQRAYLGM